MHLMCLLLIPVFLFAWLLWKNSRPGLTEYTVASPDLPEAFSGMKIAHISDLHNDRLGKDNCRILALLKKTEPDIIVFTGDLVDSRRTNIPVAAAFARAAVSIAPCYYVTGNHESRLPRHDRRTLMTALTQAGVTLLPDRTVTLSREGFRITLTGSREATPTPPLPRVPGFHILLKHRPEEFPQDARAGFHLILSGHTHGGQMRLPFLGGVFIPGQGFFGEYDAGHFVRGQSQLVISRGLGNSLFPLRIFNPPEVVLIRLCTGETR